MITSDNDIARRPADVTFGKVIPFLAIAFGLAWGVFVLIVVFPEPMTRLLGPISATNPLFFLAVYSPALAAFALVIHAGGLSGLCRYLGRLILWRAPLPWLVWVLVGIPVVYAFAAFLQGGLLGTEFAFATFGALMGAMGFMLILGPVEEFGWRGVLQPLLQRRVAPVWAGLIVGLIWGIWHLPAFLLSGTPQSGWDFAPFLIGATAVAVILTPFFNASGGSILWPALYHFQLNNPLWPDAQPVDMYLFVIAAVVVVWINRDTMFSREAGVTEVIPGPVSRSVSGVGRPRSDGPDPTG